ncbi:hypothetical protein [Micromonospora sp. NPDC093277]|uniref:hypothetical protein n=1 Tax=Micromonospora sp. NPDC093277 TaxID=3364291 RepID=UPI0037FD57C3
MPLVAERLAPRGDPVVAVQLDNEIGTLSWVTNSPDLTDGLCADLARWAVERYGKDTAAARIGADPADPAAWSAALRTPVEERSLALHDDLGRYMRDRYRRYATAPAPARRKRTRAAAHLNRGPIRPTAASRCSGRPRPRMSPCSPPRDPYAPTGAR